MKGKKNESFDPKAGEQKPEEKTEAKVNGASGDVIIDAKTGEIKDTVEERKVEVAAEAKEEQDEKLADRLDGVAAEMAATLPAFLPKCNGLVGDVQKAMVEFGKRFFPGWNAMTEDQQNAAIRHTGDMATNLVSKTINIMAPCSFPFYEIDIPKYTVDRDKRLIGANYTVSIDAYDDLRRYKNWIVVPRDVANFYDKGKVIKSDKIGTLGLTEPVQMRKDEEPAPPAPKGDEKSNYDRAVELVRAENNPSASFIQRKLDIGYNAAVKLIEQMEAKGVVGPADAVTHKRELLPFAGAVLAPTDPPPPPASGPGTPTDPDVMDAVGKGLEAAAAVDAKKAPEAAATTP